MKGFLLVDKPKGMTSFDVVRKVRKLTGEKKVGHAGTLDPLATGLLILALGEGTKLLEFFIGMKKEYEVVAHFGYISDTYDADGKITLVNSEAKFLEKDIEEKIQKNFLGNIFQTPPAFSAIKVNGKKAYELARKGEDVNLKKREIEIFEFKITKYDWPNVSFKISCSSGTYIRSLIHDLGQILKCGAYVKQLRRTKINNFHVKNATSIEDLKLIALEGFIKDIESIDLSEKDFEALKDGKISKEIKLSRDCEMAFYNGKLVGVLEKSSDGKGVKYRKMIL